MSSDHSAVLITGAGSGIGRELTRLFLADGDRVLAVSLLQDELDHLDDDLRPAPGQLLPLAMDLSTPDAAADLHAWCRGHGLEIDTLVNNAGFACFGEAVTLDVDRLRSMIALNIVTLTELCMLFGRDMKARGRGGILNVGSTAGMMPAPRIASYGGSKSYVNTFSYALRVELEPYGVNVTCLTPGAVQTNFAASGGILDYRGGESMLKRQYGAGRAASPAEVARAAHRGFRAGKAQVLVGKGALMAAIATRLLSQPRLPTLVRNL